ncbi:hypothetical protein [Bacillus sp. Marseille-Q1617]|uniref:hypothetical protein n=1 Tax=Bacillus sp. Marseille-Q1617 TaxID=2736887 RepID=UPI001588AFD8|nr:hypothetical protein [Bacillus sp. Marseille-Q1617]
MTTFLFFVSFLLNIVSLLAIIILYTRQNRFIDLEKRQGKMLQEMEETISTYLIEMKEENEAFINSLHQRNEEPSSHPAQPDSSRKEEPSSLANKRLHAAKAYKKPAASVERNEEDSGWSPPLPDDSREFGGGSLVTQVITLQQKGLSIEEIAKRLGKGKTEIELLLKFNQKS